MKAILKHKLLNYRLALGLALLLCLTGSVELFTHGGGGGGHGGGHGGHGGYGGRGGYGRGGWGGYGWGVGTGVLVGASLGGAYGSRGDTTYVTNNYDSNNCYINRSGEKVCVVQE